MPQSTRPYAHLSDAELRVRLDDSVDALHTARLIRGAHTVRTWTRINRELQNERILRARG